LEAASYAFIWFQQRRCKNDVAESYICVYPDRQLIAYECQAQKVAAKAW